MQANEGGSEMGKNETQLLRCTDKIKALKLSLARVALLSTINCRRIRKNVI